MVIPVFGIRQGGCQWAIVIRGRYTGAMRVRFLPLCLLWGSLLAFAQNPDYDFYSSFRRMLQDLRRTDRSLTLNQIIDRYEARIRTEGISDSEIQRRENLIRNSRNALEDYFWNQFFVHGKGVYNTAPNSFLTEVVEGRKPGSALDYAMGEGRNALYLAKLGWQVAGFDPAAEAVALAQTRAKEMGVKLDTSAVRDADYDFGKERFDLVLFSYIQPTAPFARKVADALKKDGIVVVECPAEWFPRNSLLKVLDGFQIIRYEVVNAKADFFSRQEMDLIRMVARKATP